MKNPKINAFSGVRSLELYSYSYVICISNAMDRIARFGSSPKENTDKPNKNV